MIFLMLCFLLMACKFGLQIWEVLEANKYAALASKTFYSLVGSIIFCVVTMLVCCFLVNPLQPKTSLTVLIFLFILTCWDVVNAIIISIVVYHDKMTFWTNVFYFHLYSLGIGLITLAGAYLRGNVVLKRIMGKKDIEVGASKEENDLDVYYDKNKSSLELHIQNENKEQTKGEVKFAIAIANYTARRPDEISLRQFDKVRIISQHKSHAIVQRKDGAEGKVPAGLLNLNQPTDSRATDALLAT